MWEKVVYVANDGTEFKSEEEAFEYEMKDAGAILRNTDHFVAYDSIGRPMNTENPELGYTLENAYFMSVKTEEAVEALETAQRAYNLDTPVPEEIGHFRWDDRNSEWRELLDDLKELNDNWAALGKKFTMV